MVECARQRLVKYAAVPERPFHGRKRSVTCFQNR